MKKYIFLALLILTCWSGKTFAQQESMYTQYMFNRLIVNPAYTGTKDGLSVTALYRHQWTGFTPFNGDPRNLTVSAHAPILDGRSGIGGYVTSDWMGVIQRNTLAMTYAFRFQVGKTGAVSLGLSGGVQQYSFNNFQHNPYNEGDPALPNGAFTVYRPNFGTGAFYNNGKFYAGISAQNLIESKIDLLKGTSADKARYYRHYYLTTGYDFRVSDDFLISPSGFVRYVQNAPVQFDLNCNFTFVDKFWVGASYRFKDAMCGIIGFNLLPQMRLSYAYDYSFFNMNRFNTGSHEVMLNYDFGNVTRTRLQIPRYF